MHSVSIFPNFRFNWPFFIDFKSFWPLICTKPQIWLGPFPFRVVNQGTENLMKNSQVFNQLQALMKYLKLRYFSYKYLFLAKYLPFC